MDCRVPAYVSRRAWHTSSSAYQHSPSDQVGARDDVTFWILSIYGATRRAQIFVGLGDLPNPKARRLRIYVERADVFPTGVEVLLPAAKGQGDLPVLGR